MTPKRSHRSDVIVITDDTDDDYVDDDVADSSCDMLNDSIMSDIDRLNDSTLSGYDGDKEDADLSLDLDGKYYFEIFLIKPYLQSHYLL